MVLTREWTDEALMQYPSEGESLELVNGEPVVTKSGVLQELIAFNIGAEIRNHARPLKLGIVVGSSTGFRMSSGNIRSPDTAYLSRQSLGGRLRPPEGFQVGAPDLAVEVLSPSETIGSLNSKIREYFASGCRLLWVVNPYEEIALVYRSTTPERLVHRGEVLLGDDVLPGFELLLDSVFPEPEE